MPAYISLIRAINLAGRNVVSMADLKAAHEALGFENVRTHLQSGNVVFTAKRTAAATLEKRIAEKVGYEAFVRTPAELAAIVDGNPFPKEAKADPGRVHVVFLSAMTSDAVRKALLEAPEQKAFGTRELYVYYADGAGRSKLTNAVIEKKLGVRGTARNWNTVTRLLELASALEG